MDSSPTWWSLTRAAWARRQPAANRSSCRPASTTSGSTARWSSTRACTPARWPAARYAAAAPDTHPSAQSRAWRHVPRWGSVAPMLRIRVFSAALLLLVTIGGTPSLVSAAQQESISFHRFAGSTLGASDAQMVGTRVTRDALLQLGPSGLQAGSYADPFGTATVPYESGTWTSPSYAT